MLHVLLGHQLRNDMQPMSDATQVDTLLRRMVDEVSTRSLTDSVSLAIQKIAEEIAKEALSDPEFRASLHTLVRERSRFILDRLLTAPGGPE